jgi:hypothetical protein
MLILHATCVNLFQCNSLKCIDLEKDNNQNSKCWLR